MKLQEEEDKYQIDCPFCGRHEAVLIEETEGERFYECLAEHVEFRMVSEEVLMPDGTILVSWDFDFNVEED